MQQLLASKTNQNETAPTLNHQVSLISTFFQKLKFFMKGTHFESMEHINKHTTEELKCIPEKDFQEFLGFCDRAS